MSHQNLQEAIEQASTQEVMDSEEMKKHFNLKEEDMQAMQSHNPVIQAVAPRPFLCCCCWQSDS